MSIHAELDSLLHLTVLAGTQETLHRRHHVNICSELHVTVAYCNAYRPVVLHTWASAVRIMRGAAGRPSGPPRCARSAPVTPHSPLAPWLISIARRPWPSSMSTRPRHVRHQGRLRAVRSEVVSLCIRHDLVGPHGPHGPTGYLSSRGKLPAIHPPLSLSHSFIVHYRSPLSSSLTAPLLPSTTSPTLNIM